MSTIVKIGKVYQNCLLAPSSLFRVIYRVIYRGNSPIKVVATSRNVGRNERAWSGRAGCSDNVMRTRKCD